MSDLLDTPLTAKDARLDVGTPAQQVLHRSHLIGMDTALTRVGGGNFSAKGRIGDEPVLWMSSWGCDGATTTEDDFPALRLSSLLELRAGPLLDDSAMLDRIAASAVADDQKAPGIETLTHAFIRARHVDHCHPDAVIALTCIPEGRELAAAEFGREAIWFDYRQFDMGVARELADRIEAQPGCRFVLLANHGIFTWADTSAESYRNCREAVRRANRALRLARGPRAGNLGGRTVPLARPERAREVLFDLLPVIRGALRARGKGIVLRTDTSPSAARFASSVRGPRLSQSGPGCPDSLVTVGYRPLALAPSELCEDGVRAAIERYRGRYAAMFARHASTDARRDGPREDLPRVLLLPGIGIVSSGADAAQASICADHFAQTRSVIEKADTAGGYTSLTEQQGIADEYWPLMRMKPLLRTPAGSLCAWVVLVAGGAPAVAGRFAHHLAKAGAHVMVESAAVDRPGVGGGRLVALDATATRPDRLVQEAVLAFGGFDAVVDMTDDDRLLGAVRPVFARQRGHGVVCVVGRPPSRSDDGGPVRVIAESDPTLVAERIVAARPAEHRESHAKKEAKS